MKRTIAQVAAGVGSLALIAGLAGCATARQHASSLPSPTSSLSSSPQPSRSPQPASDDPIASPPRVHDAAPTPSPSPSYALATPLTFVGGFGVRQPIDHGPEEYAEGTVIRNARGAIVAYHVASGDILDFIAERFGLGRYDTYIVTINQIRRGGSTSPDGIGGLYAGDVVNLSAFTMTRYGSSNGVVRHDEPPDPMPPQQE